ncbi:hypothetical protein SALBM135S_05639 [Streptomyces alboniger]
MGEFRQEQVEQRYRGDRFEGAEKNAVIAKGLRVSVRSVERWRRAWRQGARAALASAGPPKVPGLPDGRFAELEREPARGPLVHAWEDRRWFSQECAS